MLHMQTMARNVQPLPLTQKRDGDFLLAVHPPVHLGDMVTSK